MFTVRRLQIAGYSDVYGVHTSNKCALPAARSKPQIPLFGLMSHFTDGLPVAADNTEEFPTCTYAALAIDITVNEIFAPFPLTILLVRFIDPVSG